MASIKINLDLKSAIGMALLSMAVVACSPAGGNKTGHEYMPDMFHSTAYEANVFDYYYYNTWGTQQEYMTYAMPRTPVKGTIPRGYAGLNEANKGHFQGMPVNGHVPYYYDDTEEERTRAMTEITANPIPYTMAGAARGKELYEIYCGICHGDKGDGAGYLVRDGAAYPAQPANFLLAEFVDASEGRYYHSIMYGKNVMGGYADKLSYEERWQVIHHIRSLQAAELGTTYAPVVAQVMESVGMDEIHEEIIETEEHSQESDH